MACKHCELMGEYYAIREAQEQRAEQYSAGYKTELKDFYENVEKRFVFKDYLIYSKGR